MDAHTHDGGFVFLGHHPVVDFINTVILQDGELVDLLTDASALVAWAAAMDLATPDLEAEAEDLAEAKRLRDSLRSLLTSWRQDEPLNGEALHDLNRVLRWRQHPPTLMADQGEVAWQRDAPGSSARSLLLYLAEQAAKLMVEGDRRRLRACNGTSCVLLFWDTSRNLSRRWCSMATCGNRSKVSRHYHRHRGA